MKGASRWLDAVAVEGPNNRRAARAAPSNEIVLEKLDLADMVFSPSEGGVGVGASNESFNIRSACRRFRKSTDSSEGGYAWLRRNFSRRRPGRKGAEGSLRDRRRKEGCGGFNHSTRRDARRSESWTARGRPERRDSDKEPENDPSPTPPEKAGSSRDRFGSRMLISAIIYLTHPHREV